MAAANHAEAAVVLVGVVEREQHVREPIELAEEVGPVGRVLVPAEARALARALQVELVREQGDALVADQVAHRLDEPRIVQQPIHVFVEVMERLDHADRLRSRSVLELDRRAAGLVVDVAVNRVARARAVDRGRRARDAALGRGAEHGQLVRLEYRLSDQETIVMPCPALGF
jgi:hypothetical protein